MSTASLLLALITTAYGPASDSSSQPVMLDFHAEWCGPCQKVRKAVQQLTREGYPIRSIDIDQDPALARRYQIKGVPTFIVIDGTGRELDRTSGVHPAADLARFYNAAAGKVQTSADSDTPANSRRESRGEGKFDDADPRGQREDQDRSDLPAQTTVPNPKPWKTVVRIRVIGDHSTGFGSGTIISSTPVESVILTCAHIFKLDGRKQFAPAEFPRRIMIDLFDGKLQGTSPARVHFLESVVGTAVDYDFKRDVGLIRIRPGRQLPASRVVPAYWEPKSRMEVLTVGCSEGSDASVWPTVISRSRIQNFLGGNPTYEAVECDVAPKQGRSGGGLYTQDGYIVGVCNFAEPQGNHGLYATPRSIYNLLDRNQLTALYAPVRRGPGDVLADRRPALQPRRGAPVSVARSQSPDNEEPAQSRPGTRDDNVLIPAPHLLGIADPIAPEGKLAPQAASGTTRRTAWHPAQAASAPDRTKRTERAEPTDPNRDAAVDRDRDRSGTADSQPETTDSDNDSHDRIPRSVPASSTKSQWRAVKVTPANQGKGFSDN
jgi:thiol-disulfide isomerase/thioredoxin